MRLPHSRRQPGLVMVAGLEMPYVSEVVLVAAADVSDRPLKRSQMKRSGIYMHSGMIGD